MPVRFGSMGAALVVLVATWTSAAAQEFCYGTTDGECLQPDEWPDVCDLRPINTGEYEPCALSGSC